MINRNTDTLYKIDENNNVRVWFIEQDNDQYRTHSGVQGGKIVISGWKTAKPKNVGKKNATSGEEQASSEILSKFNDQISTGGYYRTEEEARENIKFYFEPMLAHKWGDHGDTVINSGKPYYSQPKFDGIRCIVTKDGMKTRNGKDLVSCPHIFEELKSIFIENPSYIFDGELYNHELKTDFEKIVSLVRKAKPSEEEIIEAANLVEYHVYDIYDTSKPNNKFSARSVDLFGVVGDLDMVKFCATNLVKSVDDLDAFYGIYLEDGYEGQMVRTDTPYEQKRSRGLLKRKEFEDKEFPIDRLESGVGNWDGAVKRVFIVLEDGSIQGAGVRGKYEDLKIILENAESYVGTDVTVRFQNRTSDNKLRFPVVTVFWKGKRDV